MRFGAASWACVILGFVLRAGGQDSFNLEVKFSAPALGGIFTNTAGQPVKVSRLDFLVADFSLHQRGGEWRRVGEEVHFVEMLGKARPFKASVAAGEYDQVRFLIGLRPKLNHAEASGFPAGHALNPGVNGLHWGWSGGYVFLALEGHWNGSEGFSYHLANDAQLMRVEQPLRLSARAGESRGLEVELDIAAIIPGRMTSGNSSTHSRVGDPVAMELKGRVEKAVRVRVVDLPKSGPASQGEMRPEITERVPYRFTFPASFPRPELPRDNPLTEVGVELGRRLFEERRLSINNSQSCASCHRSTAAFSDAGKRFSTGAEGVTGTRNAMGLFNLAWKQSFFWDGRAASLREQVLQPIGNPVEMHESMDRVVGKIRDYAPQFSAAFGSPEIVADRIARALEQFLLSEISGDSKFDRSLEGRAELSAEERRGFELFVTEFDPRRGQRGADCFHCHGGALFSNRGFANNGLPIRAGDVGRLAVTGKENDRGLFAVPSLRNVAVTGPYMHDGRFATLEEVVEHYNSGVSRSETLDPNLAKHPDSGLGLDEADRRALVAFLKTLTDARFEAKFPTTQILSHMGQNLGR